VLIPNQYQMKIIYTILLIGFSLTTYGQDSIDFRNLK